MDQHTPDTPVNFNFLRTLADFLQGLKPPYVEVKKIVITAVTKPGGIDYVAEVKGKTARRFVLAPYAHQQDCTWGPSPRTKS